MKSITSKFFVIGNEKDKSSLKIFNILLGYGVHTLQNILRGMKSMLLVSVVLLEKGIAEVFANFPFDANLLNVEIILGYDFMLTL